jgi:valyl-tRNA synthetase
MKLSKAYEPNRYEADIYALWEKNGAFLPVTRGGEGYFSMVLPPPNANANLHIGHALTVAVEDAIIRYHRMKGRETLFLPGADHAGFETWVVYEKKLNQEGKSRFDFSREELYKQVWEFVQGNKHNFETQLRALGASLDWSKFTFTLDPKVVETTYNTFQKMWDDDLIYRGKRIVNFCTFHGTSFSDIEVIHQEEDTKLWHIAYPLADGSGEVVIATTRPETKLGQSALMVNPKDDRYKNYIGRDVLQPLVPAKPIKIIADDYVDMSFGTGVVTVTPGHDVNDYEVAKRHNLPIIDLITTEGKMSDNVPEPFRGLTVQDARTAVEAALNKGGYLRKVEEHKHSVGKCYKCGTNIEPLAREQWFVRMSSLAESAIKELNQDKIKFYPASKKKQIINYLSVVKDWNISRQIAWGIPIPAFQNIADPKDWIFDSRVTEETIEIDNWTYKRDPDVFDTWFSSGQWPYVTLNYPDDEQYKTHYPLSLMETGGDILYQWVARMIMLSLYVTNDVPFTTVYIHGYVLAEDGTKMSKSLGNVIDPMTAVAEYGSDALRMGLLTGRRAGINQGYNPSKVKAGRNFANKLWNVARFIEDKLAEQEVSISDATPKTYADHWILAKMNEASNGISDSLENYRLSEAYDLLYQFVWGDLADWYIEASKTEPNLPILAQSLDTTLKLAHPFAPFVTEAIWQTLGWEEGTMLAIAAWPTPVTLDSTTAAKFQDIVDIVSEARRISTVLKANKPTLFYRNSELIKENALLITSLGHLGSVVESAQPKGQGIRVNKIGYDCWLNIDIATTRSYIDKLIEQKSDQQLSIDRLESRLTNPDYTKNAPPEIVAASKAQLEEERALLLQTSEEITTFSKLAES